MVRIHRFGLLLLVAFAAGSCATSAQLARRSAIALQGGDTRHAYEWAKKSLDKDAGNADARAAMHEAVQLMADDWKQRIRNLAMDDTVNAARQLPGFRDFRDEAAAYRAPVDPDSAWAADERRLRETAGRLLFEEGEQRLDENRPKKAYEVFTESALFDPRRAELDDRIAASYGRALTRIAILPIENETGRAGLGGELTTYWEDKLGDRVRAPEFRFTRLVPSLDVRNAMDVRRLTRDDAVRIGKRLGAQQVLWGRVYGLDTETHESRFRDYIYRRYFEKDTAGRTFERYEPASFEAITRERHVSVLVDLELLSTADGRPMYEQKGMREHVARTAYSTFQAEGSCDDYVLVPKVEGPHYDVGRARESAEKWKAQMPDVKLTAFLERARKEHGRRQYEPRYREWFYRDAQPWVFLDDLPPAGDLAFGALVGEWKPMFEAMKRLEPVDEVDAGVPQ